MADVDGGELLVRALRAEGVDLLVSIPDIGQSPMLRSAERAGMRLVHPRHESAAVHMAEAYARTLPRARREIIHGAGHLANIERPEEWNALLRDFLKKL